ncbi:MFS transporter [Streptosporangium sp. KLBMP 9127]|nr:MFS transporter [Streptosporangium sp. KLBMP 9127]
MALGRTFGFLWSSTGLSNLADGVLKVGAPLLAVSLTRSPTLVSLVGAAATLPWLLCALHAGAIADRRDRRWVMTVANWTRTGALGLTAVLAALGHLSLPLLLAALLVAGVAEVFADTSAQSLLPMVVPRGRLADANGRIVGAQTVGNDFLGSPAAGFLVGVGAAAIFGAPALLYAAAGLLLLGMRGRFRPENASTRSLRADIGEGLRYLRDHRVLRAVAISAGMLNTANAAYWAVFVLWAVGEQSPIGLTPGAYGLLMTAIAAGAVLGSLASGRALGLFGEKRTLVGTWLVNSLLLLVPVLVPLAWPTYAAAVLMGATGAASNVIVISLRQRLIPEQLLGRVNSAYRLIGMGGMPIGAAAGGVLGDLAGLPAVFVTAVAVCMLATALVARAVPAHREALTV